MAGENKKQNIKLHLYDTEMAVRVDRDEEEYYRQAAKLVNERVNTYYSILNGKKTEKEILFAAMLDLTLQYVKEEKRNDTEPFQDILNKLTSEIEQTLNS